MNHFHIRKEENYFEIMDSSVHVPNVVNKDVASCTAHERCKSVCTVLAIHTPYDQEFRTVHEYREGCEETVSDDIGILYGELLSEKEEFESDDHCDDQDLFETERFHDG